MRYAKKRQSSFIAFCLGSSNPLEKELMKTGRIKQNCDEEYEVFSQEAKDGKGEIVHRGDYVKIDSKGFPYPNSKEFYESKCINVGENLYQQISSLVEVWFADDPICDFVAFLLKVERLHINEADNDRYFQAYLWGAPLSAARDSAVIAYSVTRNTEGEVIDVDFNFVVRDEFERLYEWC